MDFKKMSDEEIFEYLFTSSYSEISTIDDSKFLLEKYKSFIRIMKAKKDKSDNDIISLKNKIIKLESEKIRILKVLEKEKIKTNEFIELLRNKKLSFKERIKGKLFTDFLTK